MTRTIIMTTVSALALSMSGAALAQTEGDVLEGQEAFGSYQANEPGTTRMITPDALPEPMPSESTANWPETVERPDNVSLELPEGFSAEMIAEGLTQPRAMVTAPNGDLFVANSAENEILVYSEGENGEMHETVFASDALNRPYGIDFYPQGQNPEWVYVGNDDGIVRFPYSGGTQADGAGEVLVDDIPASGHWTRALAFSNDGETLYYAVGSESNVAEDIASDVPDDQWIADNAMGAMWGYEQGRATVLAFDPDGSNRRVFATGVRNCSGLTVQPDTSNVWCATNERDGLGNNIPFDYATHIEQGQFYGWPWYYIGGNEDPRHEGARPDLASEVDVPDVLFQSHSAPLDIAFAGDAFGQAYNGDAFVALHGSWNRDAFTGYKIVRLNFEDGEAQGSYTDFATGFLTEDGDVWGRPVGIAFGDDAMYFSEDGSGSIWRVTQDQ